MIKVCKDTPRNFEDIQNYLEKDNFIEEIIKAKHCFFYDTCSIITHSNSINREKIVKYIKLKEGIIILTKTVLMELQNSSNIIEEQQVSYFKDLYDGGIKIILLNEEEIIDILKEVLTMSTADFNKLLGIAINEVSKFKGTIYEIKNDDPNQLTKKMMDNRTNKREYYSDFFNFARSKKKPKDNLAEELMFICFIVLSRVNLIGKLVYLSNDLKSRDLVISLNKFTADKHDKEEPYQLTSARMIYNLFKLDLIKTKEEMIEMFDSTNNGN
ncbi:MAG: hypothetical protein ACI4PU_05650, partial [Intestinibacter sp.]